MSTTFQIAGNRNPVTVRQALREGSHFLSRLGIESARLDAEILLGKVLDRKREDLYLDYETCIEPEQSNRFDLLLHRRSRREPVAYITGLKEFWSRDFFVTPDVLIPRPETELLVGTVLGLATPREEMDLLRVLDIGTGSGNIAVTLAKERGDWEIWATDISPETLKVARINALRHGVEERIHFLAGNIFEPFPIQRGFFDMVVSNPPYIRRTERDQLPADVRDWEPERALDGGPDGLDFYRRITAGGHRYLKNGGFLALEVGDGMAQEVCSLLARTGRYQKPSLYRDYAGVERVVVAAKRG